MKKIFFAALMIVSTQAVFSQLNRGQWLAGGNVSFESRKQGEFKETAFTFAPNMGYFFANKFAGGLRLDISTSKAKGDEESSSHIGVGPFLRYYFLPRAKKINLFADGSFVVGSEKYGESDGFNEFAFMAGPALILSPNTSLEFALYYKTAGGDAVENAAGDRYNRFGFNIGFQVHLGK
jgi:hypothetical protein